MNTRAAMLAVALAWSATAQGQGQEPAQVLPPFSALEARGARIGHIRVVTRDIFDTADPKEDKLLFHWANSLHIETRPGVIERALLFKTGDPVSVRVIDETERLLRSVRYLYDVHIRPVAVNDGVVDIEVETHDTWSLDLGVSAGRSGGSSSSGLQLREYNLLGTGVSLSLGRSRNVDRSSTEFEFSNERMFGTWTALSISHATNSDGQRNAATVMRPFYALDTRWAAGAKAASDDRVDSVYNAGNIVSQYRHRERQAEVFGGWSPGLIDSWVNRYSLGVSLQDDRYETEPGRVTPSQLPPDQKLVTPFLRFDRVEDRFEKELNRNLIGRPEYFALGLNLSVQVGRATKRLGSSDNAWVYTASVNRGFQPRPGHTLMAAARIAGQYSDGQVRRQRLGAQAQYYLPQNPHWLFYAAASGDLLTRPNPEESLLLGGDNGLRGFPLRYQSGTRRTLITLEERFYTDLYLWQLFRVGGAAFFDAGRAWGGPNANASDPGWLSNVGVGLRIVTSRAAFSNVLHIDLAAPLNASPQVKKLQLLVKTKTSF